MPSVVQRPRQSRGRRVVIVGPSHHFYSGVSNYTASLANALSATDETSVVLLRKLVPRALYPLRQFVGGTIGYLALDAGIPRYDGLDYGSPRTWRAGRRFMLSQRPSVVVLQWWSGAVAHMQLAMAKAAKAAGAKLVVELHEVIDPTEATWSALRAYSKWAFRRLAKHADAYIVHSTRDLELCAQEYGLPREKIRVIPHGLYDYFPAADSKKARSKWQTEGKFGILQFGSIRRYKGTTMLLDAFDALPPEVARESRLIIAGGLWEDGNEILARAASSPFAESIHVTGGMVPDADAADLFAACELVTLPYLRASQSGVAAIAMAQGKSIVATRVGGLEEGLRDYAGTTFVDVDAHALRDALVSAFHRWSEHGAANWPPPARTFSETTREYDALFAQLGGP